MKTNIDKLKLFIPAAAAVAVDQITKALVVKFIEVYMGSVRIIGDFLTFIHIRNKAAGFSFGDSFTGFVRIFFLFIIPAAVMALLSFALYKHEKYKINTKVEQVAVSLIIGGGVGNLIDRFFRRDGVVDFICVKLYGFLGMEYWPTFNIADSCVVVGVFMIVIMSVVLAVREKKARKTDSGKNADGV